MDYSFSPEARAFGDEVRRWLDVELPTDWEARYTPQSPEWIEFQKEWDRKLHRAGWGAIFWPEEFGGGAVSLEHRVMFAKVLAEGNAPDGLGKLAKRLLAPALMRHGTAEQKARYLPAILEGREFWAQGFSEPGAGSDLAGLSARGVVDGDELVLDGQKVWTSHAWYCDWIFALVRSWQGERPQEGITFVLVPTQHPGVTVRPIAQINRRSEFSEVFFNEARIPLDHVVGDVGDGWRIAKSLLEFERGAEQVLGRSGMIRAAVAEVATDLALLDDVDEGVLAQLGRSQAQFVGSEVNSLRLLGAQMAGGEPGHLSALVKLQQTHDWSEATVNHLKWLGPTAFRAASDHFERYLSARSATIAAGTSEVQRDIIARRVLNLPR